MATTTPTTRLLDNYVAGRWTPATGDDALDVTNPATGETLARVPLSAASDLDAAVSAARAALPEWRAVSASHIRPSASPAIRASTAAARARKRMAATRLPGCSLMNSAFDEVRPES